MKATITFEDVDGQVDVKVEFDPPADMRQTDGTPAFALAVAALGEVQRQVARWKNEDFEDSFYEIEEE